LQANLNKVQLGITFKETLKESLIQDKHQDTRLKALMLPRSQASKISKKHSRHTTLRLKEINKTSLVVNQEAVIREVRANNKMKQSSKANLCIKISTHLANKKE